MQEAGALFFWTRERPVAYDAGAATRKQALINPRTMLRLDRWLGRPLCAVLTFWLFLRHLVMKPPRHRPDKILFVKLIEMGSTVLACPAFAEAVEMVGEDEIYILVFGRNRPIVDVLPYFRPSNVITVDDSGIWSFTVSLVRALWMIRRQGIDTAVDMEGLSRASAIITVLTGAAYRVGHDRFTAEGPYRGRLFTHRLNVTFEQHISETFVALVRALEAPVGQVPLLKERIPHDRVRLPRFRPTEEELGQVESALVARNPAAEGRPIVVLNPNCNDFLPLRRWPLERFVQLGKRILAETDAVIVITGDRSERDSAERTARAISDDDRAFSIAGCTTMRHLMSLYTLSTAVVSNDSGPCHFASLTPTRVIALFGPETPRLYRPLGESVTVFCAGLSCSPCVNVFNHRVSPCRDNLCMRAIGVDEVAEAVLDALKGSPDPVDISA